MGHTSLLDKNLWARRLDSGIQSSKLLYTIKRLKSIVFTAHNIISLRYTIFESYRNQIDRDSSNSSHVIHGWILEAIMEDFVSIPKKSYQDRNPSKKKNHTILQSNDQAKKCNHRHSFIFRIKWSAKQHTDSPKRVQKATHQTRWGDWILVFNLPNS